ncbi:hypothetical protein MKW98_028837 [Papaver atlanticum]|uniref:DNA helicase n=1 Tax=Papaver atlanticum TaxID=357466 RepID=A0AAD4X895_9MAGN|nr:hypothetical protein MKW98_028837 [Papaver atlanticum]
MVLNEDVINSRQRIQNTKTLICALNLVSRNLPLPQDIFDTLNSIYSPDHEDGVDAVHRDSIAEKTRVSGHNLVEVQENVAGGGGVRDAANLSSQENGGDLMEEFEHAIVQQRRNCVSGARLRKSGEVRLRTNIQHRLSELEKLPSSRGEDLQMKCLIELYGLKLADLQSKVRCNVSDEYWLSEKCAYADRQLFDWGLMRLPGPRMYGIADAFATERDDRQRSKKRYAETVSRLGEEEKSRIEIRQRNFFGEVLNASREFQMQVQAVWKRRKHRNDHVQTWHRQQTQRVKQRLTREEKERFQALKVNDVETYERLLKESKNERLTMFLGKTNDLLVQLGAAVQKQKDAELDGSKSESRAELVPGGDEDLLDDSDPNVKSNDLLEGQFHYDSAIHSIQESITAQPTTLEGGELRPYQVEGLQWMVSLFNNNLNGMLADEMGLGKTIQTIALIAYLAENKNVTGPHLIIAPKAVLPNWVNEFKTWAPKIVTILYDGKMDQRKAMREKYSREDKFSVMITHYDLIMRDKAYLKKIHWHYMIVDEGHRLKNHECALVRTLVKGYHIRRRLLLTGTPIQNNLQELWALLNFLLPTIFNSVQNFEEWFSAPFADRCDVSLTDEEQLLIIRRLHQVIRPFILRRKKAEVEKFLPKKTQVILKCDLSAWQKVYYQQVTDFRRVGQDTELGTSKSLQNLSMQLRKCCNHPYLFVGDYNIWQREEIVRASGKFELLDRLLPKLKKAGHRVLLFSQMTRLIDILEIYLQLHNFKYLRLDGSTKTEDRGTLLKKFNAPDSPFFMFLLSTRAGGLGLNLQTADTVIMFDSDWNPQMDQQAEDRAHRIGQKKEVRVFVLVSVGSVEEVILERAKQKMGIDAKVIQAGLFNTTSTAEDRKEMLKEIMRRGTNSLGTDVPSEREINRLAARSDAEFRMFELMDEERRRREKYKSRLMEDHEVPDWVHSAARAEKAKVPEPYSGFFTGKRQRKEVVYADTMSDLQWMKAIEHEEDLAKLAAKSKRRETLAPGASGSTSQNGRGYQILSESRNDDESMVSEEASESYTERTPKRLKSVPLRFRIPVPGSGSALRGDDGFTPTTHKRKRLTAIISDV